MREDRNAGAGMGKGVRDGGVGSRVTTMKITKKNNQGSGGPRGCQQHRMIR